MRNYSSYFLKMLAVNNDRTFNQQRPEILPLNKDFQLWFYLAFALIIYICTTIFYAKYKLNNIFYRNAKISVNLIILLNSSFKIFKTLLLFFPNVIVLSLLLQIMIFLIYCRTTKCFHYL